MATGLIGNVSISGPLAVTSLTSNTISYTCPVGVRYAIVKVIASCSCSITSGGGGGGKAVSAAIAAGSISSSVSVSGYKSTTNPSELISSSDSVALEYTVILTSGQIWSGNCTFASTEALNTDYRISGKANLMASALEMV